jgi:predicted PurR-regulated permease PerM
VIAFVVLFITILVTTATPTVVEQMQVFANSVPSAFDTLKQQLNQFGWGKELLGSLDAPRDQLMGFITESSDLFSKLTGVFSTTLDVITALFVILLMAIYLASEPALYIDGFIQLFPVSRRERMREVFKQAYDVLKGWFLGQLLSMSILGLLMTTGLWLLDVPLALTLGVFTAIMTFIPNFGPLIAGIPTVLLALSASPMTGFYTLIWVFIVQNMEGTFITPMVHRNIISLPPTLIISTQILLASVYGFIGLVVAMPLVALGMVFVKTLYIEDVLEANMNNETSDSIQIISSKTSS